MSEQNSQAPIDLSKPPGPNMVRVTFLPEGRTVEFEYGTMPYEHHGKPMSFLDVAENFNIFLDHACGGSCACTTCHIWVRRVLTGSPRQRTTNSTAWRRRRTCSWSSRLGCQAVITGPGTYVVEIPSWNRNYVSEGKPLALAESKS